MVSREVPQLLNPDPSLCPACHQEPGERVTDSRGTFAVCPVCSHAWLVSATPEAREQARWPGTRVRLTERSASSPSRNRRPTGK
jgi:hypothetical protein